MPPPSTRLALFTLLSATATLYFFYKSRRRLLRLLNPLPPPSPPSTSPSPQNPNQKGKIFFISQTGTSKTLAQRLQTFLTLKRFDFDLVDPKNFEPEDLHKETFVLILASTWEDGNPPPNGGFFVNWLIESAEDFRVGGLLLKRCNFAVFGVGSRAYGDRFNVVGKDIAKKLRKLGGNEVVEMCEGDVDEGDLDDVFEGWCQKLVGVLEGGVVGDGGVSESGEESGEEYEESEEEDEEGGGEDIVDLEDIAGKGPSRKSSVGVKENGKLNGVVKNGVKEMVTPVVRANLEKQVLCFECL